MAISIKQLQTLAQCINKVTGQPESPWKRIEGKLEGQIGSYHVNQVYRGVELAQMMNKSGGVHPVFGRETMKKQDLWNRMVAFLQGLETRK